MPASAKASSITSSAMRSDSAGADNASTWMKSTVPAMVVFMLVTGKRAMRLIPDTPDVSAFQLASTP